MSTTFTADRGVRIGAPKFGFRLPTAERPMRLAGLTKSQAENLLDWLEANGYQNRHVSYTAGKGFTVTYSSRREENS